MLDEGELARNAVAVLRGNWIREHTVPARTLYPHQWSWDAAFIAVGLAYADPERAWADLRSLFSAQWADGRVPHIVFDPDVSERDYFPGPGFWGRQTTGIVQPPVHARAVWLVHQRHPSPQRLREFYPKLVHQQEYLARHRDYGGGLVSIVHPWESGLDNSPAWDDALSAIPADLDMLRQYRRRDIEVAAVSHRPTDRDYARYIGLAASYRDVGYQDSAKHPFLVECPAFNTLYADAELALAEIAEAIGQAPAPHRQRAHDIQEALLQRLFDSSTGLFYALDLHSEKRTEARCISGLLPLLLPGLPLAIADGLVRELTSTRFGIPAASYDRTAPDFDTLRYWRGPVWINMNWLLWRGLKAHGRPELAEQLRMALLTLIAEHGCFEYFAPDTGEGIGGSEFSWTAALALDLMGGIIAGP
ncbi:amylo-alpha-1,6-glucosidase [Catelliglobosispora koreensis]|uniref:amylo-alpha-1,6-glucosidase n=1 Tax=Catelliglobosispora koreensis TaxID=129052 RepID=UPI00036FDCA6|nr:trehalase family glycosidase [Catelliglobosispora koreensis]